jgi:hypothetical protein
MVLLHTLRATCGTLLMHCGTQQQLQALLVAAEP